MAQRLVLPGTAHMATEPHPNDWDVTGTELRAKTRCGVEQV